MSQQLVNLKQNIFRFDQNTELLGLYVLRNKDTITSNISFLNTNPGLKTDINLKFVLFDESNIDINAKVRIEKGAKGTNTHLKIDVLILSEKAKANVVPSMEILEDDVKGGHGATIGMLDENQMWYLMSRGIKKEVAQKILIEGYVNSLINKAKSVEIKSVLLKELEKINHEI